MKIDGFIAVFSPNPFAFKQNTFLPSDKFIMIRSAIDVQGRRFSGVIMLPDFSTNMTLGTREALAYLKLKSPELFIDL